MRIASGGCGNLGRDAATVTMNWRIVLTKWWMTRPFKWRNYITPKRTSNSLENATTTHYCCRLFERHFAHIYTSFQMTKSNGEMFFCFYHIFPSVLISFHFSSNFETTNVDTNVSVIDTNLSNGKRFLAQCATFRLTLCTVRVSQFGHQRPCRMRCTFEIGRVASLHMLGVRRVSDTIGTIMAKHEWVQFRNLQKL